MVSDFFSCVIFARPANQPHDGPLGLVVIMNIRSFKIPRSEVSRYPIIVPWNLSRKIRIFSYSKPFFEVVCHNDLLTIKCFSTLWTKDEFYLDRTVTVFTKTLTFAGVHNSRVAAISTMKCNLAHALSDFPPGTRSKESFVSKQKDFDSQSQESVSNK